MLHNPLFYLSQYFSPAFRAAFLPESALMESEDSSNSSDVEAALLDDNYIAHPGRTPFTQWSKNARYTIVSNSIFHTASTPLALMQLKLMHELELEKSGFILLLAWTIAASLSGWANYYKYIERSTPEFGLEYQHNFDFTPEPGTLYFFDVTDGSGPGNNNGLHYLIYTLEKEKIRYDIKSVENKFDEELKERIRNKHFDQLTKINSETIKSTVELNHLPKLMADANFMPGERQDYYFFPLCLLSQLPAMPSGAILGYTVMAGQPESNKITAAVVFALLNYVKNILCDMPIIANAYGKSETLGNMGPIATQPGTRLVINAAVLLFLRNIAPALLAVTTLVSLAGDSVIPSPAGLIISVILFPFITSSFLVFTMLALNKLNLQQGLKDSSRDSTIQKVLFNRSAITNSLGLEHSLAQYENRIAKILGEIFGGGFIMSIPLKAGWWPQTVASVMTFMKALGDLALIFDPTFEVAKNFLAFFFNHAADKAKAPLIIILLAIGACACILGAIAQWPNFVECGEIRQKELELDNSRNSISSNHSSDHLIDHDKSEGVEIYLASASPTYAMKNSGDTIRHVTLKDLRDNFRITHSVLYAMGAGASDNSSQRTSSNEPMPS